MDRAKIIFGNEIAAGAYRKACRQKEKFLKKYGDDSGKNYQFALADNPVLAELGTRELVLGDGAAFITGQTLVVDGGFTL